MSKRFQSFFIAALGAFVLGTTAPANATLIGDEVILETFFNDSPFGGPFAATVGDEVEYDFGILIDISATRIDFSLDQPLVLSSNAAYVLSDLDWINDNNEIVDVVVTTFPGLIADVTFTADSVRYSLVDRGDFEIGVFASIELITAPSAAPVPEPASLALFGAGLAGLGFARRRRRQSQG